MLKVNIKRGKQYYKVMWYLAWSQPANFPCFCVKNALFETLLQPCLNTFRIGGLCETCINSQIYPHLLLVLIIPMGFLVLFFGIILFYLVTELFQCSSIFSQWKIKVHVFTVSQIYWSPRRNRHSIYSHWDVLLSHLIYFQWCWDPSKWTLNLQSLLKF